MTPAVSSVRDRWGVRSPASPGSAFTLLEVMLVVGIMGIVLAMGLPSIVRALQREPLQQAVNDVVEALNHARARAILQGSTAEMILDAEGHVGVALRPRPRSPGPNNTASDPAEHTAERVFQAVLGRDVRISFIGVNLVDLQEATEVRVRFHPNGTADDFTLVLEDGTGARKIQLDPITGRTEVTFIR
jgi:prepilin-type N-terminal cleavage/methylation domain-containing protein